MAVYEVFSHPELRRYKTQVCTKATFLQLFCIALTFIPPFLIAYRSHGFWQKVDVYQEQPDVHFKYALFVIMDTSRDGDYVAWSTYQNFNQLQMEHLRVPLVKATEEDTNDDGKFDKLKFQLDMPLLDTEQVHGVKVILLFDYLLRKYSYFQMESLAYIEYNSAVSGAKLEYVGDLVLQQREPLNHKGRDTRFNDSVIDEKSLYAEEYDFGRIFRKYSKRNVTTTLEQDYPVWISSRGANQPFVLEATIRYPEANVLYTPGFWQELKHGWIQYLAILLVFLFVFDRIKVFIFSNQLVSTMIERPWDKKRY